LRRRVAYAFPSAIGYWRWGLLRIGASGRRRWKSWLLILRDCKTGKSQQCAQKNGHKALGWFESGIEFGYLHLIPRKFGRQCISTRFTNPKLKE
jgi:hypothetical protein